MANLSSYLPGGIDPAAVTITGGSINGTTIGASTPSTGAFTTITGSGDLAIDTDTLFVDVSEDKVGIGTSSPNQLLTLGSGTGSATIGLDFETTNVTRGSILYNAGAGEMAFTSGYSGYGGYMTFDCNGAERMRIDTSGNVGIGTTSPNAYADYTTLTIDGSSKGSVLDLEKDGTVTGELWVYSGTTDIGLAAAQSTSNLRFFTGGFNERMRILSSGGVTFNGDTATANALDDYEEGTWTPVYAPSSGSFSSVTYANQIGYYTKIGDVVTVHARIDTSGMSIGSASGYLLVSGLPFTAHAYAYQSVIVGYSWGFSSVYPTAGSTGTGMTALYLYAPDRSNSTASIVPSNLGTGTTYLYISCTYKTT